MVATRSSKKHDEELATLLIQLSTSPEGQLFAHDVLESYPELAESYTAVCPRRTDLTSMSKKAKEGGFSTCRDVVSDITLMVENCIRFNGADSPFGVAAKQFQSNAIAEVERHFATVAAAAAMIAPVAQQHHHNVADVAAASPSARGSGTLKLQRKRERTEGDDVTASSSAAVPPAGRLSSFSSKQLLQLIDSFDRPEDNGMFSHDVVEMYPEVAADYDRVCPQRMDLDRMKAKARRGEYIDVHLNGLLDDVACIAGNCIRYNGPDTPLGIIAKSFLKHAHSQVKRLMESVGLSFRLPPSSDAAAATSVAAALDVETIDRHAEQQRMKRIPEAPHRQVVAAVVPAVVAPPKPIHRPAAVLKPLAFQLPMHIPHNLRRRVIDAHLKQDSSRCIMLPPGDVHTVESVLASYLAAKRAHVQSCEAAAERASGFAVSPPLSDSAVVKMEAGDGEAEAAASPPPASSSLADAADAALAFKKQKDDLDHCMRVVQLLSETFQHVFPFVLLYRGERCDVDAYLATALHGSSIVWSCLVHTEFLVRLIMHFPQLLCLVASSSLSVGGKLPHPSLKQVVVDSATHSLVLTVAPVLEDILCFIDAHFSELFGGGCSDSEKNMDEV